VQKEKLIFFLILSFLLLLYFENTLSYLDCTGFGTELGIHSSVTIAVSALRLDCVGKRGKSLQMSQVHYQAIGWEFALMFLPGDRERERRKNDCFEEKAKCFKQSL